MARLCVCIPTWNGARYLARTLRSVLVQQGVDLRVIVGDDASEDNTVEIARSFHDPRLSVQAFSEHAGLARNWNRVLHMADGDYVALVGQDDEVNSKWAAQLTALLDTYPQADLAFGRRHFVFDDEESRRVLGNFFERLYPKLLAPFYAHVGEVILPNVMLREAYRYRFEINLIGEPTFVILRRSSTVVERGFDPLMTQMIDWEFFTRFFVDRPIVHCPEVLGTYHIHRRAWSIENAAPSRHYREYDYLLGIVLQRFGPSLGRWRARQLQRRRSRIRAIGRVDAEREQVKRRHILMGFIATVLSFYCSARSEERQDTAEKTTYNFLANAGSAEIIAPQPKFVNLQLQKLTIKGDQRTVIFEHPNSEVVFNNVLVHKNAVLQFGIGISEAAWDKAGDGVLFEVIIVDPNARDTRLFSEYIDPKKNAEERKWLDYNVDLKAFSGEEVSFVFRTDGGPNRNTDFDWAAWSDPQIISERQSGWISRLWSVFSAG